MGDSVVVGLVVVLMGVWLLFGVALGLTGVENVLALAIHEGVVGVTALFIPTLLMFGSITLLVVFVLLLWALLS